MSVVSWNVSVGSLLIVFSIIVAGWRAAKALRGLVAPIGDFIEEHDVLWEDYNIRTGGGYRRRTGRGSPPEPEDFYADKDGRAHE